MSTLNITDIFAWEPPVLELGGGEALAVLAFRGTSQRGSIANTRTRFVRVLRVHRERLEEPTACLAALVESDNMDVRDRAVGLLWRLSYERRALNNYCFSVLTNSDRSSCS